MIRVATEAELAQIYTPQPGYETVCFVLDEEGITGHVCVSRALGQVFGHNMEVWSEDPTGALRLWRRAKQQIRDWGATRVLVHFDSLDDPMIPFWEKHGFRPRFTVYEGDI